MHPFVFATLQITNKIVIIKLVSSFFIIPHLSYMLLGHSSKALSLGTRYSIYLEYMRCTVKHTCPFPTDYILSTISSNCSYGDSMNMAIAQPQMR